MSDDKKKDIDKHTGVETTGHEWDGIKELNNPAPRWWLWVFYVTVIWAVWYWFIYPAWPTLSGEGFRGGTEGSKQWTQYSELKDQQQEIVARKAAYLERFRKASFLEIQNDSELYEFALAGGKSAFKDNCATCHGTGGAGSAGYPNLNDDDWIWGGRINDIYQTIKYGVRSNHDETHISQMPAFGGMLNAQQLDALADYVLSLSNSDIVTNEQGRVIFSENCASCHGSDGKGDREFGAPNLADALWLYGDTKDAIISQINKPKHGMMPNWNERLDEDTIRQLTIYVHSLGGGE